VAEHLVFGRTGFSEPLTYQGTLDAEGPDDARRVALARYGSAWVELTVVPAAEARWVLGTRREVRA
jgi:hypothetical protein